MSESVSACVCESVFVWVCGCVVFIESNPIEHNKLLADAFAARYKGAMAAEGVFVNTRVK